MTIQVKIRHDQRDSPQNIRVAAVDASGRLIVPMSVLRHGEECSLYVYKGVRIEITEDEAQA